jgi:hypothetical protein
MNNKFVQALTAQKKVVFAYSDSINILLADSVYSKKPKQENEILKEV